MVLQHTVLPWRDWRRNGKASGRERDASALARHQAWITAGAKTQDGPWEQQHLHGCLCDPHRLIVSVGTVSAAATSHTQQHFGANRVRIREIRAYENDTVQKRPNKTVNAEFGLMAL
ncbi:unnamed protein product [Caenorhabditis auriculariae]|uniref:Uncharacterized protein n=1 Tax=Caenorhabditis auriculariae TaxID=2777116 RepID=A0A8S1H545_9PELO|nr:unnamed protein product [Caenorhabditis auriculariae]